MKPETTVLINRSIEKDGLVYLKCPDCNGSGQKSQQEIDALMPCHECKAEGYISVPLSSLIESSMPSESLKEAFEAGREDEYFYDKNGIDTGYYPKWRNFDEWLKNKLKGIK